MKKYFSFIAIAFIAFFGMFLNVFALEEETAEITIPSIVSPAEDVGDEDDEAESKIIDRVVINDVAKSFIVGTLKGSDLFTAVADSDKYYVYKEFWDREYASGISYKKGDNKDNIIIELEKGEILYYSVAVALNEEAYADGWRFATNVTLVINGEEVDVAVPTLEGDDESGDDDSEDVISGKIKYFYDVYYAPVEADDEKAVEIRVHYRFDEEGYIFDMEERPAILEVDDNTNILNSSCLDIDFSYFEENEEEVPEGYDYGAYFYLNSIAFDSDEQTVNARLTLPILDIFSNSVIKLIIDNEEYTPTDVVDGYVIFDLELSNNVNGYNWYDGTIYLHDYIENPDTVDNVLLYVITLLISVFGLSFTAILYKKRFN